MKSNKLTNILLTAIFLGVLVIIFLVKQQTIWERSWFLTIIEQIQANKY